MKKLLLLIVIAIVFSLNSCSCSDPTASQLLEDTTYVNLITGTMLAPPKDDALLSNTLNSIGEPLLLEDFHDLRVRYFTGDDKSHEFDIEGGGGLTLGGLYSEIEKALNENGIKAKISTSSTGYIMVNISSGHCLNLVVDNLTQPLSDILVKKLFFWEGDLHGGENGTKQRILTHASEYNKLVNISDSTGRLSGLTTGDIIESRATISGITNKPIETTTTDETTISDLMVSIKSATGTGKVTFTTPKDIEFPSRIIVSIPEAEYNKKLDEIKIIASNTDFSPVSPAVFNSIMYLQEYNGGL